MLGLSGEAPKSLNVVRALADIAKAADLYQENLTLMRETCATDE